jgi:hypothetical protein
MKKVVCIDDAKLPPGAEIVKGNEYSIKKEFINNFDQKVFIIDGINNEGRTKMGLPWIGYNAKRFADVESLTKVENYEQAYVV